MNSFALAMRLLWRDSRAGELTILFLALLIAVTCSTAITLFSDRLERTMTDQTAEFLAADMVITSHAVISEAWLNKAVELNLSEAQTAEFSSVLMEHDELLLAGVKAVSDNYPLRGFLKSTKTDYATETIERKGPKPGEAWVDKRILSALKLNIGDPVTIGEKKLLITKIITYEPDKQGDLYSLSPRLMMNKQDLDATGIVQPGSHVHYFYLFSGNQSPLSEFKAWVKPQLNLAQRILDIHEDRPELGSALDRAERYLGLSTIVVIVISGVAIAMATRRYVERHLDATAIMRCLGSKQNDVLRIFITQFLFLGLITSMTGCALGWVVQELLFKLLRNLLPQTVSNPSWLAVFFGLLTGITVLIGFSLPPLLQLKRVSPARVLRRDLEPLPASAWLVYGSAMGIIGVLIWRYTQDLNMTAIIFIVGVLLLIVLGILIYFVLKSVQRLIPRLSLNWRFGLQGLFRNSRATITQILAFTITLVAMALSFTVRNDLIENWHKQLPEQAPNHFALNIFPDQMESLHADFKSENIAGSRFFPIIRGRLTQINGEPVQKIVSKDSQGESATHRELSLTYTNNLPDDNKIIAGSWWTATSKNEVSVEQKLADSLKIKLGDRLMFVVGGQELTATVSSIRSLQWETMKPNFYMIFSPGTLESFPGTFLTSFYLPESKKTFLNALIKKYPAMTILEVDLILKQFKTILTQLTAAINYLLYFALLAGFTVLFSAIYSTLDNRIYESALLRTFGANRSLLRTMHIIEFFTLGLISGVFAVILSESLLYALYAKALNMDYRPSSYLWYALPIIGAFSVGLAGCWGVNRVVNTPPLKVLRDS
ncbi:MAG: FtsX-like permease family protein [Methylococcaceae bacterium]|nr:FtsX-like permease family protein [Methylococcaceae bacterium]